MQRTILGHINNTISLYERMQRLKWLEVVIVGLMVAPVKALRRRRSVRRERIVQSHIKILGTFLRGSLLKATYFVESFEQLFLAFYCDKVDEVTIKQTSNDVFYYYLVVNDKPKPAFICSR